MVLLILLFWSHVYPFGAEEIGVKRVDGIGVREKLVSMLLGDVARQRVG
jgi:hypothetical protein